MSERRLAPHRVIRPIQWSTTRRECPHCDSEIMVNKDGTFRAHYAKPRHAGDTYCPGTREKAPGDA